MKFPSFSVTVPATTANLGPGFDSVGLAFNLFMSVNVTVASQWQVIYSGEEYRQLASDERNLIIQTIQQVAGQYNVQTHPLKLFVTSDIPLGKGFGSSATAIAAGIVIADHLYKLRLTDEDKVRIGTKLEGHADNISAALLGGVVINYFDGETVDFVRVDKVGARFITLIPPTDLKTTEARAILPTTLSHADAVKGSAANAVLVAALSQNDWQKVGKMMAKDQLHETYRKKQLPHFDDIRQASKNLGAYGMTISGAGPSLVIAVKEGTEEAIMEELQQQYPYYMYLILASTSRGASVTS